MTTSTQAINLQAQRFLTMKILLIISLVFILTPMTAQTLAKKVDGKFINAYKDYKTSLQLDLNPDSTFNYVFHHSIGSCYASGVWKNHLDSVSLIRTGKKNLPDSVESFFFPNFIGKEKWFFKNDTLYLLDKSKLTNVKLIRN